jgi:hypothetical protein
VKNAIADVALVKGSEESTKKVSTAAIYIGRGGKGINELIVMLRALGIHQVTLFHAFSQGVPSVCLLEAGRLVRGKTGRPSSNCRGFHALLMNPQASPNIADLHRAQMAG